MRSIIRIISTALMALLLLQTSMMLAASIEQEPQQKPTEKVVAEPDGNRQDDQESQTNSEPLQRTNSPMLGEASPITTTMISRKSNPLEDLKEWFDDYRRIEEAVLGRDTVVEGYRALTFFTLADGHLQRGLAIDLGDGQVLTHLTTNRGADIQELFDGAKQFIGESFQTNLTSTTDSLACNCVLYARSQVPSLPYNLTYFTQKLAVINHRFPRVGSVAVIEVLSGSNSIYGHVAVVRNVGINFDGTLRVTIQEANWYPCQITWRTGTPDQLKIRGYFDQAYSSGSASPRLDSLSPSSGSVGRQFWTTAYGANFDPYSVRAIVLGGNYCTSFDRCVIPNNVIANKTTSKLNVPITIGGAGTYTLYFFNSSSGKTSNGKPIIVR